MALSQPGLVVTRPLQIAASAPKRRIGTDGETSRINVQGPCLIRTIALGYLQRSKANASGKVPLHQPPTSKSCPWLCRLRVQPGDGRQSRKANNEPDGPGSLQQRRGGGGER